MVKTERFIHEGHAQLTFTCSKVTTETLEKDVKCSNLTIKTPERRQLRQ